MGQENRTHRCKRAETALGLKGLGDQGRTVIGQRKAALLGLPSLTVSPVSLCSQVDATLPLQIETQSPHCPCCPERCHLHCCITHSHFAGAHSLCPAEKGSTLPFLSFNWNLLPCTYQKPECQGACSTPPPRQRTQKVGTC